MFLELNAWCERPSWGGGLRGPILTQLRVPAALGGSGEAQG